MIEKRKQCPECSLAISGRGKPHIGSESCWGNSVPILNEDIKAVWTYWKTKKKFSKADKQWLLTGAELMQLMRDASVTINDIGVKSHQYQLARHGDTGHYEMGNCRFITMHENLQERSFSPEAVEKLKSHPHCKKVSTPHGTYASQGEAAKSIGVSHPTIRNRVENESEKWKEWHLL